MLVIRPVKMNDLDALYELAMARTFGLSTLPQDKAMLEKRIRESERAMQWMDEEAPRGDAYLFVMEEAETDQIVGTSGIVSKVGGFEPSWTYKIETSVRESKVLNVRNEVKTLHLTAEHDGPSEIGTLFLLPQHRGGGNGRLLSLCRFMFVADHPQHFDERFMAEMRGVIDEHGRSPFWEAIGRHFFNIDFHEADSVVLKNKRPIAELMPKHPIYVPLLPQTAQDVIGKVHESTKPALNLLESEGFRFGNEIDIFEAGPVVYCKRDDIRVVRDSCVAAISELTDDEPKGQYMVSSRYDGFRCVKAGVNAAGAGIKLSKTSAGALGVGVGDTVRYATLRPQDQSEQHG